LGNADSDYEMQADEYHDYSCDLFYALELQRHC